MIVPRRFALATALGAATMAGPTALAADPNASAANELSLTPSYPIYAQAAEPRGRRPLMALLDRAGIADALDDARINIYGRVEAGYTYNFDKPIDDLNLGRVFDVEDDEFVGNQISLNFERTVELDADNFDWGFRVELLYGGDARFLHANGMYDDDDFFDGPEMQFDPLQVYADFNLPIGTGLRLRAGKFLFFKQVDPNASVFYSHSYTFGAALPFTLSGLTGFYRLADEWTLEAGVVRGWDDACEDDNDGVSVVGRMSYRPSERTTVSLLGITGPEQEDDDSSLRTALDFVVRHEATDRLTFLLDVVFGHQADAQPGGPDTPDEGDAYWYGIAGYAVYEINDYLSAGTRLEWYHDTKGYTTGTSNLFEATGGADLPGGLSLYEATVGVTITPFPDDDLGQNLKIRPEIRYDYSSEAFFSSLTDHDQVTFGIDAIFNF